MNTIISSIRSFFRKNQIFFTIIFGLIASFGILYAIYHPHIKENSPKETRQEQPHDINNIVTNSKLDHSASPRSRLNTEQPKADTNQTQKKPLSQSIVQNMNDSPGGIQVGVNQAPVIINAIPASRHVTQEQHDILLHSLRPYSGTSIDVVSAVGTKESAEYAAAMESTLREAGISLRRATIQTYIPATYGLIISPDEDLLFFRTAFTSAQIGFQIASLPGPVSRRGIFIGLNPTN